MIITIDGPTASGKSTTAKLLAKQLDIYYLNTGLLYRTVAYLLLTQNKDLNSSFSEDDLNFIEDISYKFENKESKIYYKNQDLTSLLKNSSLDQPSSIISKNSIVRKKLLILQRKTANDYSIVADGRDCGSVVFPNADFKFYLTANMDVRAKRMLEDLSRKNSHLTFEEVRAALQERDKRDMNRTIAPLTIPKDGTIIDNSDMTIEQTLKKIEQQIQLGSK